MNKRDTILVGLLVFIIGLIFTSMVFADSRRITIIENTTIEQTIINQSECSNSALALASGQHNYRSTNQLQWSSAGSYIGGSCDKSAASFGLAKQLGSVFGAANFSTDLNGNNAIGFSFSGKF